MEVIVDHSKNCREKMEQNKKLREINKKINEDVFEALKLYRELHTKNVLARYHVYLEASDDIICKI